MSIDCFTHAARSPGPKSAVFGMTASTLMYSCGPFTSGGRFGLSRAFCAVSCASSTTAFSESSSNSRVDALPCFWPWRTLMVSCWSYCTMFTVIEELAQRVADRSPPSKFTSTVSALAMFRTLSVSALISSCEYIIVHQVYQREAPMKSSRLSRLTPYLLSVLRLVAAFIYIAHGTQKMFGVPGHPFHAPLIAATTMGAAGVLETTG